MKLLLDQNLSHRLIEAIAPIYPGSLHVRSAGLDRATDDDIWRYARDGAFCIVTQDTDFLERALVVGTPPAVICLRLGNTSTANAQTALLSVLQWFPAWVAGNPPPHVCEVERP